MTALLDALDARVDRCPGCDAWRFDGACTVCAPTPDRKISRAAALEVGSTPLAGLQDFPSPAPKGPLT